MVVGSFCRLKKVEKRREKYYFNEVLDFNWLGVRMMCWVRVHVRISL